MEQNNADFHTYLKSHGVTESSLLSALTTGSTDDRKLFSVGNDVYCISHYLDDSAEPGYGIIPTNRQLHLDSTNYVAIALVEGDDVIYVDTADQSINLWLVENGNGKHIHLGDSFTDFCKLLQFEV